MVTTIALIDYGAGNVRSASRALARSAELIELDAKILMTADPEDILGADRIVLPGVGHYADCMAGLQSRPGQVAPAT